MNFYVGIIVFVLVVLVVHFWVQANKHRADANRFRKAALGDANRKRPIDMDKDHF